MAFSTDASNEYEGEFATGLVVLLSLSPRFKIITNFITKSVSAALARLRFCILVKKTAQPRLGNLATNVNVYFQTKNTGKVLNAFQWETLSLLAVSTGEKGQKRGEIKGQEVS